MFLPILLLLLLLSRSKRNKSQECWRTPITWFAGTGEETWSAVSWQRRREQESEQDVPVTISGFSEGIEQAYISQIRI